jgi:4-diphosphocytidyl-2-C-methyl-D-erythritol kinase
VSGVGDWVRIPAPAKVNLWLEVLARRPDGYHELDTGLLALELADEVAARARSEPGVRLELAGRFASADVPCDERNLAWRAAAACLDRLEETRGIELRLVKNVPSRAGLGAGSSDAAATLRACEAALDRTLDERVARQCLAELGSDCVFFRAAERTGLARCTGRGEQVEVLAPAPEGWHLALLVPDVGASTAEVYAALATPLSARAAASTVRGGLLQLDERAARGALFNGLEEAALSAVDGLAPWRALLDGCGLAHFRLSGSGSSFFGLFRDPDEAARCPTTLAQAARKRGLTPRALLVTRPARSGIRVVPPRPG